MRSMLFADWCVVRGASKNYLVPALAIVFVAFATGLSDVSPNAAALAEHIHSVAVSCGIMMLAFFGFFGFFGNDEREGWEAVRLSLPVARRDVVRSRYAVLVLWFVVVAAVVNLLGLLSSVVAGLVLYGRPAMIDLREALLLNGVILAIYLLYLAIETPIFYRLGLSKARMYFSLPFMACLLFTLDPVKDAANALLEVLGRLADAAGSPLPLLACALVMAAVAFCASMLVSERIYAARDF